MIKIKYNQIYCLIGLFMTVSILPTFKGIPFTYLFLAIISFYLFIKNGRMSIGIFTSLLVGFGAVTTVMNMASSLGSTWKKVSIRVYMMWIILWLFYGCVKTEKTKRYSIESLIFKGIVLGCILNVLWGVIQVVLYAMFRVNLNEIVFSGLGGHDNLSAIRSGEFCLTGLNWHPSQMVPILVVLFLAIDNIYVRCGLFIISALTNNSTCVFGLIICIGGILFFGKDDVFKSRLTKKRLFKIAICVAMFFIAIVIVLSIPGIFNKVTYSFTNLLERLYNVYKGDVKSDKSTYLHFRYYYSYPEVVRRSTLWEFLFGRGFNCSGYAFSAFFHQFTFIDAWITESDPINFLIGNGLIWTFIFYAWILWIAIKGRQITYKYTVFSIAIIFCGILYNNQSNWMLIVEILMSIGIIKKINLFHVPKEVSILNAKKNSSFISNLQW